MGGRGVWQIELGMMVDCDCFKRRLREERSKKATPLPKVKVIIIGSIVLVNQFAAALIFPFLPFMVHDFFPQLSKDELGQKAGFLGSAFFVGSFAGSLMWGWISDLWGRRPVMLLGICGSIFSELLFGVSQNFEWAIAARFLWGFLNGNIGVAKTYLSEICDDTNQAQGFSIFGTSSGLGRLLGSVVGGFLAQPASKYYIFEHPFFCHYPYVLPVFIAVGIGMFSLTTGFCFLNETLHKAKESTRHTSNTTDQPRDDSKSVSDNSELNQTDIEMISLSSESESELKNINDNDLISESDLDSDLNASDTELLLDTHAQQNEQSGSRRFKLAIRSVKLSSLWKQFLSHHKQQCIACCYCCFLYPKSQSIISQVTSSQAWKVLGRKIISKLKEMFKLALDRRVVVSILLYGLVGYVVIIINELFPLMMVTDHIHGGYKMDDNEIATFIMIVAVVQLIYQPIVFPRLVQLLGYRKLLRISLLVFTCGCFLLPWSNIITGPVNEEESLITSGSGSGGNISFDYCGRSADESSVNVNSIVRLPVKVWAMVLLVLHLMIISRITAFGAIMVMINNSALPEMRGSVNGIGQSLVAIARAMGPTSGALLFAWSERNGSHWPWNYHLSFEFSSLLILLIFLITFLLPKTIEKKRERERQTPS